MKAFTLLLSLLLSSVVNGLLESTLNDEGVVPDEDVPQEVGFARELLHKSEALPGLSTFRSRGTTTSTTSSGKGKGKGASKGSKGMVTPEPACDTYRVYYLKEEYRKNLNEINTGGSKGQTLGFSVDRLNLYDARTDRVVGFVTETNLITGTFDCTATGALSFAETSIGRSKDQMFYQGTCSTQIENAITGGTGTFQCAAGTARVFRRTPTRIFLELTSCGTC